MNSAIVLLELGFSLAIALVIFMGRSYLLSYFAEKAKNLATKEDIRSITDEVERVRFSYTARFEELAQQNRLIIEQGKPFTAEEALRRQNLVNAKLQAYYGAIDLLARMLASMTWTGPRVPQPRRLVKVPDESEINAAVARLSLFTDDPKLLNQFYLTAVGGEDAIKHWEEFVALARKDMNYGQIELHANQFKYVFGRE